MVIAVIAILAALLLPALVGAKMQAARIQCMNNEKQMVLAWTIYSGDNNTDKLVLNGGAYGLRPPPRRICGFTAGIMVQPTRSPITFI